MKGQWVSGCEVSRVRSSFMKNWVELMFICLCACWSGDIALDLLQRCPRLAFARDKSGLTPILALAQMPCAFPARKQLKFWQGWLYSCIRKMYDMKVIHVQALELLDLICKEIPALAIRQLSQGLVYGAILEAVIHGNVEFLVSVIKANPSLLWTLGKSKRGIFMYAVEYRQEKILSLIYGLGARKHIVGRRDGMCNNMLHLAGMLPRAAKLDQFRGAALQMQREMQWFKEVESVLHPKFSKERCMLRTPREVFTENHKDLKKKGEEWMKDTARPCVVVSAIIFAIMFAAAFIIPSSNISDPAGFPLFLHDKRFTIFTVSYALSLFASMTSMLTFISILTSHYAEEDFLKSLPAKMILGLSTLCLSVGAMGVAFFAALGRLLDGRMLVWLLLSLVAYLPITVFVLFLFPTLLEMLMSTFGPSIFCRKMKRWL